jgi:hypothetical protein
LTSSRSSRRRANKRRRRYGPIPCLDDGFLDPPARGDSSDEFSPD